MSEKNMDSKNRWRTVTVAFRMSPEENQELETRVKLMGFRTRQEYIIQSLLNQKVVVTGNPLMLVQFRKQLQHIEAELSRLNQIKVREQMIDTLQYQISVMGGGKRE